MRRAVLYIKVLVQRRSRTLGQRFHFHARDKIAARIFLHGEKLDAHQADIIRQRPCVQLVSDGQFRAALIVDVDIVREVRRSRTALKEALIDDFSVLLDLNGIVRSIYDVGILRNLDALLRLSLFFSQSSSVSTSAL